MFSLLFFLPPSICFERKFWVERKGSETFPHLLFWFMWNGEHRRVGDGRTAWHRGGEPRASVDGRGTAAPSGRSLGGGSRPEMPTDQHLFCSWIYFTCFPFILLFFFFMSLLSAFSFLPRRWWRPDVPHMRRLTCTDGARVCEHFCT